MFYSLTSDYDQQLRQCFGEVVQQPISI